MSVPKLQSEGVLFLLKRFGEAKAMLTADRSYTQAGLYPYMLWTTPGNQEAKAMLTADRSYTQAGLYPYMLWTAPGNQETKAMLIADRQTLTRL